MSQKSVMKYGKKRALIAFLTLAVVALATMSSGATGSTSSVIQPSFFGATIPVVPNQWPVTVPLGTLAKTASGGSPGGTYWSELEPFNGTFNWSPLDNLISQSFNHGVTDLMYTLYETPTWASSNPSQNCFATQNFGTTGCAAPPKYMGDWDHFVTTLVTRYKFEIKYYELWNEPNVPSEFSGNVSDMVTMAQHAYSIIKSIEPNAVVLAPGVAVAGTAPFIQGCSPSICWLAEYLKAGGGNYADGIDFHGKTCLATNAPCTQEGISCTSAEIEACAGGSLVSQINAVRSLMATYGVAGKILVDSEGGYSEEVGLNSLWGSPDQQTAFVARFYILQASENVSISVLFSWNTNAQAGLTGFGTTGAEAQINQGYDQVYVWLVGASFNGPCTQMAGIWTCGLTGATGTQELIAFSDTNSSATSFTPPPQFSQYEDLKGQVVSISPGFHVPLNEKPILMRASGATTTTSTSATIPTTSTTSSTTSRSTTTTASTSTTSQTTGIVTTSFSTRSSSPTSSTQTFPGLTAFQQQLVLETVVLALLMIAAYIRLRPEPKPATPTPPAKKTTP